MVLNHSTKLQVILLLLYFNYLLIFDYLDMLLKHVIDTRTFQIVPL